MAGIYIHIPFCITRCFYCSFHSSTSLDNIIEVAEAINKELFLRKDYIEDEEVETIYFGGGTPSLMSIGALEKIFNTIQKNFKFTKNLEVTLEANPDDITKEILKNWQCIGVNRLSVGFQTFSERLLKFINRRHNLSQSLTCLDLISKSPFSDNFNLDLIFALPTQTKEEFDYDIKKVLEIRPPHISAYMMTFEEKSIFGTRLKKKEIIEQPDDFCAQCFMDVDEKFCKAGYEHYEISNFARDKKFSKHNSNYWVNNKKFLGVGPAAASYNIISRQTNVENNYAYIQAIAQDIIPSTPEFLSQKDVLNEFIFNNLRTSRGLDLNMLKEKFDYHVDEKIMMFLIEKKFLRMEGEKIFLTPSGMVVSNRIIEYFFVD